MCLVCHWRQFSSDPLYGRLHASPAVAPFIVSRVDPGADSYDKVGADVYRPHGETVGAGAQWGPVRRFASARGKCFFAGEAGVDGQDADVVSYLHDLDMLLKRWRGGSGAGQIEALCWTTRVAAEGDFRLDASADRLAEYRRMAQDQFYGASV
jgi:hypothetical protein